VRKGLAFASAAFLGSFLLFLIQPMAAKRVLPFFGGAASVWTACLLFFQVVLFLGYAYAAVTIRRVHLVLLLVSAETLWGFASTPDGSLPPVLSLLFFLASDIGIPFFVLSAGSTLVQRWAGSYSLYAVSNAGSLLALLAYPVLFEPWLNLTTQRNVWIGGTILYFALLVLCMKLSGGFPAEPLGGGNRAWASRPEWKQMVVWAAWPALGTALLSATTNQLSQEVAAVPFLWIAPLAVYLLSFIATFSSLEWARSFTLWSLLLPPAAIGAVLLLASGPGYSYRWHLLGDLAVLAIFLMLCHGRLAASRPSEESLGWFYAAMSAGGALGGLFVAVVSPLLFSSYTEFPLALAGIAMLAFATGLTGPDGLVVEPITVRKRVLIFTYAISILVTGAGFFVSSESGVIETRRNFYGILQVTERNEAQGPLRMFIHGQTIHGTQWLHHPDWPTTYFNENSGAGRAIADEQRIHPRGMRVGIIGLGAGTLAHYARPGLDTFRFYELNPDVEPMARKHFSYLDPGKKIQIVLGDARISLEREIPAGEPPFDLFLVDAFSSDSIPVHLLTREAAAVYAKRVKMEGTMLFHISNRTFSLEPVIRGMGRVLHRRADLMKSGDQPSRGANASEWVRLSPGAYEGPPGIIWTDAYSSVWPILRRR